MCVCVSPAVTAPLLCPQRGCEMDPGLPDPQAGGDPAIDTYAGSSQRAGSTPAASSPASVLVSAPACGSHC